MTFQEMKRLKLYEALLNLEKVDDVNSVFEKGFHNRRKTSFHINIITLFIANSGSSTETMIC
jgi:hypothetical protein